MGPVTVWVALHPYRKDFPYFSCEVHYHLDARYTGFNFTGICNKEDEVCYVLTTEVDTRTRYRRRPGRIIARSVFMFSSSIVN